MSSETVSDRKSMISLLSQILLTILFVGGYLWMVREFMTGAVKVDPTLKDVFVALIGVITGSVATVMNFWFSSSRSSQAKDEAR